MRIDLAYCIELGRVVDIQEACREFAAQDRHEKFNFLCSDPICRISKKETGVRITGANHYKLPEEHAVIQSPHYRKLDDHLFTCEWVELNSALRERLIEKGNEVDAARTLQRKITRLVTRFVIPEVVENEASDEVVALLERIRRIDDPIARRKARLEYARGAGSTATSLEALVSCYEELLSENALTEEFTIAGYGRLSFRDAFQQLPFEAKNSFAIYHGGAYFKKNYSTGFLLSFYDKVSECGNEGTAEVPISFYVSSTAIKDSRHGFKFRKMVNEAEKNRGKGAYLKVYWIGSLKRSEKGYEAVFSTLSHVVMRLAFSKSKKT